MLPAITAVPNGSYELRQHVTKFTIHEQARAQVSELPCLPRQDWRITDLSDLQFWRDCPFCPKEGFLEFNIDPLHDPDPILVLPDRIRRSQVRPFLGEGRLQEPMAITYGAEQDAYYVLDRTDGNGPSVTLYRIGRGNVLEPLGTWARPDIFTNVALTTGVDGTLVFSTWSDSQFGISIIDVSGQEGWPMRVLSMAVGDGTINVPAYRNLDGTTLVLQRAGTTRPLRITPFKTNEFDPTNLDVGGGEVGILEQVF
jgi:hypothetical protein